eukprot:6215368-Prymnesium_polylepis.2
MSGWVCDNNLRPLLCVHCDSRTAARVGCSLVRAIHTLRADGPLNQRGRRKVAAIQMVGPELKCKRTLDARGIHHQAIATVVARLAEERSVLGASILP